MATGNPTFGVPINEAKPGHVDLQKEQARIAREKGLNASIGFLIENQSQNPGYVRKQAEIFLGSLGAGMEEWSKTLFESSVRRIQADLYADFQKLNEQQKTRVGGFPGFIKKEFADLIADAKPEEKRFFDALLVDAGRNKEYNSVDRRRDYEGLFGNLTSKLGDMAERIKLIKELEGATRSSETRE